MIYTEQQLEVKKLVDVAQDERIDNVSLDLSDFHSSTANQFASITNQLNISNDKFDDVVESVNSLSNSVDSQFSSLSQTIGWKLDSMNSRIEDVNSRVNVGTQVVYNDLNTFKNQESEKYSEIQRQFTTVNNSISSINRNVNNIRSDINGINTNIRNVYNLANNTKNAVNALYNNANLNKVLAKNFYLGRNNYTPLSCTTVLGIRDNGEVFPVNLMVNSLADVFGDKITNAGLIGVENGNIVVKDASIQAELELYKDELEISKIPNAIIFGSAVNSIHIVIDDPRQRDEIYTPEFVGEFVVSPIYGDMANNTAGWISGSDDFGIHPFVPRFAFANCPNLSEIDDGITHYDTNSMVAYEGTFYNCQKVGEVRDLFNGVANPYSVKGIHAASMFENCSNLNFVSGDFTGLVNGSRMFRNCRDLLEVRGMERLYITNASRMFEGSPYISPDYGLTISSRCGLPVNTLGMFYGCRNLSNNIYIADATVSNADAMFEYTESMYGTPANIVIDNTNLISAKNMFRQSRLKPVIGNNVVIVDGSNMFKDCETFEGKVRDCISDKTTNIAHMFEGAKADISYFTIPNTIENMDYAFCNMRGLMNEDHIGSVDFYPEHRISMTRAFRGLTVGTIYISKNIPKSTSNAIYNTLINNGTGYKFEPEQIMNTL